MSWTNARLRLRIPRLPRDHRPRSSPLAIRTTSTIGDIDQPSWDTLAGHHVVTTHAWLALDERSALRPKRHLHFLAEDSSGLAGGICGRLHETPHWQNINSLLLGQAAPLAARLGIKPLPALVCGPEKAAGEAILLRAHATPGEQISIAESLLDAVEQYAAQNGWFLCFRNIPTASPVATLLRNRRYLCTAEWPTTHLDLPGPTFLDYRHELRKSHPTTERNLPRERNKAKRHGLEIKHLAHPEQHHLALHQLFNAHYQRLNQQPFPYQPSFFAEFAHRLGPTAKIYTAIIEGELLGATLLLYHGDSVHLPLIAFDPSRGRDAALYFNLAYNEPIANCAAAGFRRLILGRTQYALKLQRGCQLVHLNLYLRPPSGPQNILWPALLAARDLVLRRRLAASLHHEP